MTDDFFKDFFIDDKPVEQPQPEATVPESVADVAELPETVVRDVTLQVGHTGILTPIAELQPVDLNGTAVSRAMLYSFEEIKRKNIKIGDRVLISKTKDALPSVFAVVEEKRTGRELRIIAPKFCPACGARIAHKKDETFMRCQNQHCRGRLLARLEHFTSRAGLDIEGFGGKVAAAMTQQVFRQISDPLDIFDWSPSEFAAINLSSPGDIPRPLGIIRGKKMAESVSASKHLPLHRWLYALGIPTIGDKAAKKLARSVPDWDTLVRSTDNKVFLAFLKSDWGRTTVTRMANLDINPCSL